MLLLVETYRITNETIRFWACNTPCVLNIATQQQPNWIGKVARMPEEKYSDNFLCLGQVIRANQAVRKSRQEL
jgi:hypothetical protein